MKGLIWGGVVRKANMLILIFVNVNDLIKSWHLLTTKIKRDFNRNVRYYFAASNKILSNLSI